jgi:hypothetical protein
LVGFGGAARAGAVLNGGGCPIPSENGAGVDGLDNDSVAVGGAVKLPPAANGVDEVRAGEIDGVPNGDVAPVAAWSVKGEAPFAESDAAFRLKGEAVELGAENPPKGDGLLSPPKDGLEGNPNGEGEGRGDEDGDGDADFGAAPNDGKGAFNSGLAARVNGDEILLASERLPRLNDDAGLPSAGLAPSVNGAGAGAAFASA